MLDLGDGRNLVRTAIFSPTEAWIAIALPRTMSCVCPVNWVATVHWRLEGHWNPETVSCESRTLCASTACKKMLSLSSPVQVQSCGVGSSNLVLIVDPIGFFTISSTKTVLHCRQGSKSTERCSNCKLTYSFSRGFFLKYRSLLWISK
jgi:hypothetical protein